MRFVIKAPRAYTASYQLVKDTAMYNRIFAYACCEAIACAVAGCVCLALKLNLLASGFCALTVLAASCALLEVRATNRPQVRLEAVREHESTQG